MHKCIRLDDQVKQCNKSIDLSCSSRLLRLDLEFATAEADAGIELLLHRE